MARVVLTQPIPRITGIATLLRERGHQVLEWPVARLTPDPPPDLRSRIESSDWVIVVSPGALAVLFDALADHWAGKAGLALIGPGSRAELERRSLARRPAALRWPDGPPWDAAALMAREPFDRPGGLRCLVARGESGREDWIDRLRQRGAHVDLLSLYRRSPVEPSPLALAQLEDWRRQGQPVCWLFTQASALGHCSARLGQAFFAGRAAVDRALVIHPRIEAAARQAGFRQVILIEPGTEALASALESALAGND